MPPSQAIDRTNLEMLGNVRASQRYTSASSQIGHTANDWNDVRRSKARGEYQCVASVEIEILLDDARVVEPTEQ